MKLFDAFLRRRNETPDAPAFLIATGDRSIPITWRQFTDDIAVVGWILETNMPHGVVGLIGENSYEWMVLHAACLFTDATIVPIDVNLNADEIARRLRVVGASALVHSALYAEKSRLVSSQIPGLATGGFGTRKTDHFLEMGREAIGIGVKTLWDRPAPDSDRTSMIVFTSGTTAEPRGVELATRGLEAYAEAVTSLGMREGDRSLMLLPLHHIFGIAMTYNMLCYGVALGVCPDFRRVYDAVERFHARFLFLVPALAEILAMRIEQHGRSAEEAFGSPLDWITIGGAPLPRRTFEHLQALGIKPLPGYGITETTGMFSFTPSDEIPRAGSAGKVAPGVEAKVSAEGELLIRGPNVMKGYYKMPDKTASALDAEGWYRTGDIGRIDEDGYVWITGRASRTIVLSSGKKVAPEELEEKLLAIPGVLEAVVRGEGEKRVIQAEVYASIPEASVHRAVDALNKLLPLYQRISDLKVRQEPFPRTASGKIKLS